MYLKEANENEIEIDDVQGSLIYNQIDDQESEVIISVWLKYDTSSPDKSKIMAKVSGQGDEYDVAFDSLGIDHMFNVLDAIEKAIE
jgi:hypothetical protein